MIAHLFEEHSSVLAHWFAHGWAPGRPPRTLVCLDAHLDLQQVDDGAMARLLACNAAARVAALERPHPLCPGDAYAYGLEDWIVPAHRLGLIDRVVWVAPPHVGARFDRRALDQLCQMDGVTPEDIAGFHRGPAGCIEGRLLGVPLTLCELGQLPALPLPRDALIDVDIDFFVEVPGDHAWTTPAMVLPILRALWPDAAELTLCRSVGSGFTPLRWRYLADWLAAGWTGRQAEVDHFTRLHALECRLDVGAGAELAPEVQGELVLHPGCEATRYLWRRVAGATAAASEPATGAYADDLLREACAQGHRRLPTQLSTVLALERTLITVGPSPRTGWSWAAVGLLHAAFGRREAAIHCFEVGRALAGPQAELALAIGRLSTEPGQDVDRYLDVALADTKHRTAALALRAEWRQRQGALDEARLLLTEAVARAPAWPELQEGLAAICLRLGQRDAAAQAAARAQCVRDRLQQTARGLA